MKKITITLAFLLLTSPIFAQALQTGNLVGVHVITIELKKGVTMSKFQKFHVNKLIPEYEKNFPGWQLFLAQGLRGENQNKY